MKPILQTTTHEDDIVLRTVSAPVSENMFGTPELAAILSEMEESLDAAPDGVALAAPQIGLLHRIFIVRHDRMLPPQPEGEPYPPAEVGVFINPKIVRTSQRRLHMDEGCLSVHGVYGKTHRHDRATVQAQDEHGEWFERGAGGILAQAYQHEIDHLNGMLFIDHARDLVEVTRDEHHPNV